MEASFVESEYARHQLTHDLAHMGVFDEGTIKAAHVREPPTGAISPREVEAGTVEAAHVRELWTGTISLREVEAGTVEAAHVRELWTGAISLREVEAGTIRERCIHLSPIPKTRHIVS